MRWLSTIFFCSLCFLLFPFLQNAAASENAAKQIEFTNGYILEEYQADPNGPPGKKYYVRHRDSKKNSYQFAGFRAEISEIFYTPNSKKAAAVLIKESDGGSGGWWEWHTLLFVAGDTIQKESFNFLVDINLDLENDQIFNLIVKENALVKNNLGDEIEKSIYYEMIRIKDSRTDAVSYFIVKDGAKRKYTNLLGKYYWDFLGSDDYRTNLVARMGASEFKNIREKLSMGSSAKLIKKRYVLLPAAQKIYWENFAIIAVDTLTGEEALIHYNDKLQGRVLGGFPSAEMTKGLFPFTYQVWYDKCLRFFLKDGNLKIQNYSRCSDTKPIVENTQSTTSHKKQTKKLVEGSANQQSNRENLSQKFAKMERTWISKYGASHPFAKFEEIALSANVDKNGLKELQCKKKKLSLNSYICANGITVRGNKISKVSDCKKTPFNMAKLLKDNGLPKDYADRMFASMERVWNKNSQYIRYRFTNEMMCVEGKF